MRVAWRSGRRSLTDAERRRSSGGAGITAVPLVVCCGDEIRPDVRQVVTETVAATWAGIVSGGPGIADGGASPVETGPSTAPRVVIVDRLCGHPEPLVHLVATNRPTSLVVAACTTPGANRALDVARRAGVDSARSAAVSLAPALRCGVDPDDSAALGVVMAGAVALAASLAAQPAAGTELAARRGTMDRTALLRPWRQVPRRSVVQKRFLCYGAERCGACVPACPTGALRVQSGDIQIDQAGCSACGACGSACPAGALSVPGAAPEAIAAEVRALVDAGASAVVIGCVHDRGEVDAAVAAKVGGASAIVGLPCAATISPGQLLGLAAAGLHVEVAPCTSCADEGRLQHAIDVAVRVLRAVEQFPGTDVRVPPRPGPEHLLETWCEPSATNRAALALLDRVRTGIPHGTKLVSISVSGRAGGAVVRIDPKSGRSPDAESTSARDLPRVEDAPGGSVAIDPTRCTGCGACALACPSGAIVVGAAQASLVLDPFVCLGCRRCADVCPEGAVVVHRGLDLAALVAGPGLVVPASPAAVCPRCGTALVADPLLGAVLRRLAPRSGGEALMASLARCTLCGDDRRTSEGTEFHEDRELGPQISPEAVAGPLVDMVRPGEAKPERYGLPGSVVP